MKILKKQLSVILAVALIVILLLSASVTSFASDESVYNFSSDKWDWWGAAQGTINGKWGQNDKALTRNYSNGAITYDVSGISDTVLAFQQIQDKWKSMPAGDFYLNFTNNTSVSVETKIVVGSTTVFDKWVGANSTSKIEFKNDAAGSFSIFVMNWNTTIPGGNGLFTFSPVYKKAAEGESTTEKEPEFTLPKMGNEYSSCTLLNGWGAEGMENPTYIQDNKIAKSAAKVSATGQMYVDLKDFEKLYDTAVVEGYENIAIDIYVNFTSGSGTTIKYLLGGNTWLLGNDSTQKYYQKGNGVLTVSMPLNNWVPSGKSAADVKSIRLYAMGWTYGAYEADVYMSVPYIPDYSPKGYNNVMIEGSVTKVESGSEFVFPENNDIDFVGYSNGTNLYAPGDSVIVNEDLMFTKLRLSLFMEKGASIRYFNPTGMRFYTSFDLYALTELENMGATVQLGTLITRQDKIGDEQVTLNMSGQKAIVPYNSREWYTEGSFSGFVGSIVNFKEHNLNAKFIGRGFAKISLGDFETTVYAGYYDNNINNNLRSVSFVANGIKNSDAYNSLSPEHKRIVDTYADKYIAE